MATLIHDVVAQEGGEDLMLHRQEELLALKWDAVVNC